MIKDSLPTKPTLIKVDFHDLSIIEGREISNNTEAEYIAKKLCKSGIGIVIVNNEKDIMVIANSEKIFEKMEIQNKLLKTKDSSDAIIAGFAVGFSKGLSEQNTIKVASMFITAAENAPKQECFYLRDQDEITMFLNSI